MTDIAVIGGGISGLAAACALLQSDANIRVTLLESSPRVGGVIETHTEGNYLIEKGADNFASLIPDALELSRQCGLEGSLIGPRANDRRAFVLHGGKLLPIPSGFSLMQPTRVGSILATGTLSLAGKLRLLGEFFVKPRSDTGDESLESFVTRRLGREAFENLVEPIVSGIFTADPSTLSMQATMPQFIEMERKSGGLIRGHLKERRRDAAAAAMKASGARYDQFRAPSEGMSSWIEAIAETLPAGTVQLNSSVQSLQCVGEDSSVRWKVSTADDEQTYDGVICALPASPTAQLLREEIPDASQLVKGIEYASSAVVAMVLKKSELSGRIDGFGMISPSKENRSALAISYTSNKYPGRTPDDEILLRVFLGGALHPEIMDKTDSQLEEIAAAEVRAILGWSGNQPCWQRVVRWSHAMPQYVVGHVDRVDQLDEIMQAYPTLRLCGAAYRGVGIPQCVREARKAAESLLEGLNREESAGA